MTVVDIDHEVLNSSSSLTAVVTVAGVTLYSACNPSAGIKLSLA